MLGLQLVHSLIKLHQEYVYITFLSSDILFIISEKSLYIGMCGIMMKFLKIPHVFRLKFRGETILSILVAECEALAAANFGSETFPGPQQSPRLANFFAPTIYRRADDEPF